MIDVQFIEPSHEVLGLAGGVDSIARAARTCYRSESNASTENDERLVRSLIKRGHEAMVEHAWLSVRFVTDRAIANEIVRHRLFSFAQESTRYCNYDGRGFRFIMPPGLTKAQEGLVDHVCKVCAMAYSALTRFGVKPEIARCVLPLCTATEIVVSGNLREWRHAFRLRTDPHAHPQMIDLMVPVLEEAKVEIPVIFDDIGA